MDAPQRWQVASLVTAVAGLSAGAVMMTRTTTEPAPTIQLDVVAAAGEQLDRPGAFGERLPEIVRPALIEDDGSFSSGSGSASSADDPVSATPAVSATSAADPVSVQSVDSPDDAAPSSPSVTTQGATSSNTPSPAPAPADSPDSVDSTGSADSD